MVYDLESLITNAVKEALERVLKKTTLFDVLFPQGINQLDLASYCKEDVVLTKQITKSKSTVGRKINYPKCAYPGCEKNRFARGKGFCGEHYKMYLAGEAKSADEYADGAE